MRGDIFPYRVLVVDTETTGLPFWEKAEVIEIGACVLSCRGIKVGAFSTLLRPSKLILDEDWDQAQGALSVSGLTREELESAPRRMEALAPFHEFCARMQCPSATAYNVRFDKVMLARDHVVLPWGDDVFRVAQATMREHGVKAGFKLIDVCQFFGVGSGRQDHRALSDSMLAADVLVANERL